MELIKSRLGGGTVAQDILKWKGDYFGTVHGDDENGLVDVEFPNVFEASAFARSLEIDDLSVFREPVGDFLTSVVVQIRTVGGEEETDNAGAHA